MRRGVKATEATKIALWIDTLILHRKFMEQRPLKASTVSIVINQSPSPYIRSYHTDSRHVIEILTFARKERPSSTV